MPPLTLPEDSSYYYPHIYVWIFQVVSFPLVSRQNPVCTCPLLHTCYMHRQSHSYGFDQPNNMWRMQIIKLLVMLFCLLPCYLVLCRPIYSQPPILKRPQSSFLPQCERPCFTPIQNNRAKLWFCISESLYFWVANWKTRDSTPSDRNHSLTSICS